MEIFEKYRNMINKLLFDFNLNNIILLNEEMSTSMTPCFAFSCIFEYTLPLLISSSKIGSKCFFCILEPEWLKLNNKDLYLLYGICMDANGQSYFYQPKKPILISFFINFYIYPSVWKSENRIKFLEFELKTDCPKSSSFLLSNFTNDKLYTRILASSYGVNVPKCIAFVFDIKKYSNLKNYEDLKIFKISKNIDNNTFLKHLSNLEFSGSTVVIKPSGTKYQLK